jgi:hypothetical protein
MYENTYNDGAMYLKNTPIFCLVPLRDSAILVSAERQHTRRTVVRSFPIQGFFKRDYYQNTNCEFIIRTGYDGMVNISHFLSNPGGTQLLSSASIGSPVAQCYGGFIFAQMWHVPWNGLKP